VQTRMDVYSAPNSQLATYGLSLTRNRTAHTPTATHGSASCCAQWKSLEDPVWELLRAPPRWHKSPLTALSAVQRQKKLSTHSGNSHNQGETSCS